MSQNPEQMLPKAGEVLAHRYLLQGVLGRGGFAVVFGALDQNTGAQVAVKVLQWAMSHEERYAARFRREVKLVCRLRHHNTIRVSDFGQTSTGCLFLVMERLSGRALDEVLDQHGPLPIARVARILHQVLLSLVEAHRQGIIHRDLKPANLFLAEDAPTPDYIKVLDFGIAKALDDETALTSTGELPCTPAYVAPELVLGEPSSPASDVYSLAILAIELLEGAPPYRGTSALEVCMRHAALDSPVPLSASVARSALGPILERASSKHLADRYADAAEMLADLDHVMARGAGAVSKDTAQLESGRKETAPQLVRATTRAAALAGTSEPAAASLQPAELDPHRADASRVRTLWASVAGGVGAALLGGLGLAYLLSPRGEAEAPLAPDSTLAPLPVVSPTTETPIVAPQADAPAAEAPRRADSKEAPAALAEGIAEPTRPLDDPLPPVLPVTDTGGEAQPDREAALEAPPNSEAAADPDPAAATPSRAATERTPRRQTAATNTAAATSPAAAAVETPPEPPAPVVDPQQSPSTTTGGLLNRPPSLRPE